MAMPSPVTWSQTPNSLNQWGETVQFQVLVRETGNGHPIFCKRETNLTRLLGTPGLAKKAAQFLIDMGILTQFKYARQASTEEDDHVSTEEIAAENSW